MADKKSVLEEALLEAQQLEEAVKSNAKEILAATMKQEIEELVKESLNEQEEDDFVDMEDEEEVSTDFVDEDDDEEYEDQEEEEFVAPEGEEEAMVSMTMGADEPALDLTSASDDEVLKVFKSMGAEDGIVVTQDGDTIDIEDQEAGTEYKIELAESKLRNNLLITEDYDKNDSMDESYVDDEEMNEMYKDKESNEGYGKKHMDENGEKEMYEMGMDEPTYEITLAGVDEEGLDEMEDMDDEMMEMEDMDDEMMEMEDMDVEELNELEDELEEGHDWGGNKHDYHREMGTDGHRHRTGDVGGGKYGKGGHYKDYEMGEMDHMEDETNEGANWGGNKGDYHREMGADGHRHRTGDIGGGKYGKGGHYKDYEMGEMNSDEEMEEASRTYGFGSKSGRGLRKGITNNRNLEFPINESTKSSMSKIIKTAKQLQTENRQFREKNKEYRQALKVFRDKLNEVAVFNANLAYSTKLFTEHTTTKKEKVNILRRFDGVTTLNESKNLFNSFDRELNSKSNKLNESVQKTITKTPSGGSSVNLIESKTYESPQITRMREIMGKL